MAATPCSRWPRPRCHGLSSQVSGASHSPYCALTIQLARYSAEARPSITRRRFRVDAAFAIPALFDVLEAEGWDYAIRIKGNPKLHEQVTFLTRRRPGRPPNHLVRHYTSFQYRAKSWSKPRRIVAKVEFHPGELFSTVGFIVTNRSLPNERVLAFYNDRGTAEQHGPAIDPMTADLVGLERVRRHRHRRARSAPRCSVFCGPHVYWVRVPVQVKRPRNSLAERERARDRLNDASCVQMTPFCRL